MNVVKNIKLFINKKSYFINKSLTLIQACAFLGVEIPRFCYHEKLTIAGNCRMCLLEVSRNERGLSVPKPVASCAIPALEGMHIHNNTVMVKKARESVLEFLLINHPLDCPICDQGGECDLQDQTIIFGSDRGRFYENKRSVVDKYCGPLIKTVMTRCIHCTRCVRFGSEIAGISFLGTTGRGYNTEIGTYINQLAFSEISGNIIDLCPVGALTSKPYAFTARSWELRNIETIDILDSLGSNIRVDIRGSEIMRVLPRLNEKINEDWITDKTRFFYDGLKIQRLQNPLIKINKKFIMCSWSSMFLWLSLKLLKKDIMEICGAVGPLSESEVVLSLKDFLNKQGSSNFYIQDYNFINFDFRQNFLLNISLVDIEKLDFALLIGINPRLELPLLNLRFRKSVKYNKGLIASLGFSYPLTYNSLHLGSNIINLIRILEGTSFLCKVFLKSKNKSLFFGNSLSARLDSNNLLEVFKSFFYKISLNNSFNFINNHQGPINSLELGFLNPLKNKNKKNKLFFLCGIDNSHFLKKKTQKDIYIYIGHTGNAVSDICDFILPGCSFLEKTGYFLNIEGRLQKTKFIKLPPALSRNDWKIFVSFLCFLFPNNNKKTKQNFKPILKRLLEVSPIYKKLFYKNFLSYKLNVNKITLFSINNSNMLSPFFNYYASDMISKSSYVLAITSKQFIKNQNFLI